MRDHCNREIKHLRFSVTHKCNYNCIYCDKEGFIPQRPTLSVEDIIKICRILADTLNVTKIKLTGGEPLCRKEIVEIVQKISLLNCFKDISMTTNGSKLEGLAESLIDAGLDRINVSLGTLNPQKYRFIYGSDTLEEALRGLAKAKEVGFNDIKLNYVMLKGINEEELTDMLAFCENNDYKLQLIELHRASSEIHKNNGFYEKYHVDTLPIIEDLENKAKSIRIRGNMQNRKVLTMPNSAKIEVIKPSHDFCLGCTKLRVGCDGNLFGCLFRSDLGQNIKKALEEGNESTNYKQVIKKVIDAREPYY